MRQRVSYQKFNRPLHAQLAPVVACTQTFAAERVLEVGLVSLGPQSRWPEQLAISVPRRDSIGSCMGAIQRVQRRPTNRHRFVPIRSWHQVGPVACLARERPTCTYPTCLDFASSFIIFVFKCACVFAKCWNATAGSCCPSLSPPAGPTPCHFLCRRSAAACRNTLSVPGISSTRRGHHGLHGAKSRPV